MFFRKKQPVICAICGKAIASKDCRFVDKNRVTKVVRYAHVGCHKPEASQ